MSQSDTQPSVSPLRALDQSDVGGDDDDEIEGNDEPTTIDDPTGDEATRPTLDDTAADDVASPPVPLPSDLGTTCPDGLLPEGHVPPPPPPHEVARKPKTLKAPRHPTQAEIDEHLLTHLPLADWCECCVAGNDQTTHTSDIRDHHEPCHLSLPTTAS